MRRAWSRNARIAALLALLSFGVYGALAPPDFTSYEDKTAAVAEGIVRGVGPEIPEDTDLTPSENAGDPSITGILQPALMVPFYAAGAGVDEIASGGDDYTYRSFVLRLYSALVTALSVGVMFLLLRTLERSERASLAVALLYAFASIAMPYAGIGIEPTGALIVMLSFLFAATAARSGGTWMLAATGVVVGLATSTRPSTLLPAMAALLLLVPVLREADARERWRLVRWTAIPFALTVLVFFGYNVQRFDDPLQTGYPDDYGLGDAPSALPGLYISPGFGLVWFSPLVVLGALGFGRMWQERRTLAVALIAGIVLGTIPALAPIWAGDAWGPRYLVGVAWMPLVGLAWFATTRARRWVVGGVAALAVWIQLTGTLVGLLPQFDAMVSGRYTGVSATGGNFGIPTDAIPYGEDPPRWVPALSILRTNSAALVSIGARQAGFDSIVLHYRPFHGTDGSYDLDGVPLNTWWNPGAPTGSTPKPTSLWLIPFVLMIAGSAYGLYAVRAGREGDDPTRLSVGAMG